MEINMAQTEWLVGVKDKNCIWRNLVLSLSFSRSLSYTWVYIAWYLCMWCIHMCVGSSWEDMKRSERTWVSCSIMLHLISLGPGLWVKWASLAACKPQCYSGVCPTALRLWAHMATWLFTWGLGIQTQVPHDCASGTLPLWAFSQV